MVGALATLGLMLLAIASGAAAAESSPGGSVALKAEGTNGYSIIALVGVRPGRSVGQGVILAEKPHSLVAYSAPATLAASSVEADFGPVGRISMQLGRSGVEQTARSSCGGDPIEFEAADWVGEFEFSGEHDFTTASATSLPYDPTPLLDLLCSAPVDLHTDGRGAVLHVKSSGPLPWLSLLARTNGPGRAVEVSATVNERRDGLRIERTVERRFPSSAFSRSPDLAAASLQPPAPFSGRGVFRRDAAPAERWSGNLRLDFPGRSGVPATGSRLRATLRHGGWRGGNRGRPRLAALTLPRWPSTKR